METAGGQPVRMLREEIEWLQVSVPVGSNATKGAAVGAGIGFLVGAVAGNLLCNRDAGCVAGTNTGYNTRGFYVGIYGIVGVLPGAGIGWITGVPTRGWVEVPHTAPSPTPPGASAASALGPHIPQATVPEVNEGLAVPRHLSVSVSPMLGRNSQGLRLSLAW